MTKILDAMMNWIAKLLGIMILCSVAIVITQVFCRYALGTPLMWSEQVCRFIFIWSMLLAIPVMFHFKNFMNFDALLDLAPERPRAIIFICIKFVMAAFAVYWFVAAAMLISVTYTKYTTGVRIPYFCLYGAQNVSALLTFVVMINQVVEDIKSLVKPSTTKEVAE